MIIMVEREQIILQGGFGAIYLPIFTAFFCRLTLNIIGIYIHHIPAALAKAGGHYGVFI